MGPNPKQLVSVYEKKMIIQMHTEERACEDMGRRQPSTSQEERPQKKSM